MNIINFRLKFGLNTFKGTIEDSKRTANFIRN